MKTVLSSTEFGLFASILALLGVIRLLAPPGSFFTGSSLLSLGQQIGLYGVLAVGAAVVIISGGIDLSVGAVAAFTSVIGAKMIDSWLHDGRSTTPPSDLLVIGSIATSLSLGVLIGLFHAFLINRFGLPPFIATLATMSGLRSLASILATAPITVKSPLFRKLGSSAESTFATFVVVAIVVSVMMGCTVLGRHLFAMGGNEAAARLSGIKIRRLKVFAYGLSGFLAALAGLLFSGRQGQANPQLGLSYELGAITSAVVGGCGLAGGVGSIRGTVLGVILLRTLINGTNQVVRRIDFNFHLFQFKRHVLIQLDSTKFEGLVLGTVIILAVAINQRIRPKLG
jgi:ribose/xylose/arabinose/galactoside ABC-type transport system permease subunit